MGNKILFGIMALGCVIVGVLIYLTVEPTPPEDWPNPPAGQTE